MNPTLETIKKGQEELVNSFNLNGVGFMASSLINWHTSFLISLFEGEVERLEKTKVTDKKGFVEFLFGDGKKETIRCHTNMASGFNMAVDDQIKHYQEIIDYLKSIV